MIMTEHRANTGARTPNHSIRSPDKHSTYANNVLH